jgi:hypothetical protein
MNIKHKLIKLLLAAGLALSFSSLASAQLLTQTTLSAAVTGGSNFDAGTVGPLQSFVTLASITGLQPALLGTQVQSIIYIDREAMGVISVPTSATLPVTVIRGIRGTPAEPHVTGTMVLFGQINLLGSNAFFDRDPILGVCATTFPQSPWLNVLTSMQWLCSSITGTWVPGFGNPGVSGAPLMATANVAAAAGAILPSGPLFKITGAGAVTGFTIPLGFNATAAGGGCIAVRADTATTATWTAAGNISIAGTFTPNKLFTFCWDATTSKFVPNAIA